MCDVCVRVRVRICVHVYACVCVCVHVCDTLHRISYMQLVLSHMHTKLHALPIHLMVCCVLYTYSDSTSPAAMHILLSQCTVTCSRCTPWTQLHVMVCCVQSVSFLHTLQLYNYHFYTHTPPQGGMLCTDQMYCLFHHP